MNETPIRVNAKVTRLRDTRLVYVELPNGKVIIGHRAKGYEYDMSTLAIGDVVRLEMTPFDFEKGRIIEVVSSLHKE